MPILQLEKSIFPDNLLNGYADSEFDPQFESDPEAKPTWWAIYTKARQEKALVRQLVGQKIPCYLPLVGQDQLSRGKRGRSYHPVFSGYVFLFGDNEQRVQALQTNRISRILPVADGRQLCRDLKKTRDLIATDAPLTIERRLEAGQFVRIKGGALSGLEGTIIQRRNTTRLVIAVNYLQQGVSIQIDDFLVEPA